MGQMAAHFAPAVDRFSVLNEPDLTIPAVDDCDPQTVTRMLSSPLGSRILGVRQYPRRRGGFVHRIFSAGWRHGRAYAPRWPAVYRWVRRSSAPGAGESSQQTVMTIRQGCLKVQRGRAYRRIFAAAEPVIRAAAPGAQVLAGETSPVDGVLDEGLDTRRVADAEAAGGLRRREVPPSAPTPTRIPHGTRRNGTTLFTHDNLPQAYAEMWQFAKAQGVREMSQYGWCRVPGTGWDTALMTGDNCDPSPEYRAVQQVLAAWG
jgi:hypothetical protein